MLKSFRRFLAILPLQLLMGQLIILAERRADRSRAAGARGRPTFFFDLSDPFSYLVAERIERVLGQVDWVPTGGTVLRDGEQWRDPAGLRAHAETCAAALRLPLVWPEHFPGETPAALRAAAYAAENGAGGRFALAASRLAFCGGFDLEDPEILAEAAAAAGLGLQDTIGAAGDLTRDGALHATARGLLNQGVRSLPAIKIGDHWFDGDGALAAAAAYQRSSLAVG
jgi:2-hydroxychromene-2-carboxylate isomerase